MITTQDRTPAATVTLSTPELREGMTVYGPTRADLPPVIAHRYECPSCGAVGGEPCRLSPRFTQEYSHVARHRAAQRADWRQLIREMNAGSGPISSLSIGSVV